ncbi:hypothetical protein NEISICOT_02648 [Neisseria sicca ATCC 29256]|uniref:Uncharacterized protein n=1 Tax=Neisseria sicca ATCC 29256 TaxID=547045 RepID=C6M7Y3_NEISI|nr:hypothetical protein NEISICOT_02648 [Neisseria sicca ATCC 29256]
MYKRSSENIYGSYQVFLLCARKIRKIDKLSEIDYCQWEHTRSF